MAWLILVPNVQVSDLAESATPAEHLTKPVKLHNLFNPRPFTTTTYNFTSLRALCQAQLFFLIPRVRTHPEQLDFRCWKPLRAHWLRDTCRRPRR